MTKPKIEDFELRKEQEEARIRQADFDWRQANECRKCGLADDLNDDHICSDCVAR
jgi:hypothetical protein